MVSPSSKQLRVGYKKLKKSFKELEILAVQAANGIYTEEDRQQIQVEVSQLVDEIDRIASQS